MQLPKVYEPKSYESDIYALWEKSGAFKPAHRGGKGYFSLVAPPPNANAKLHIGYGLTMAVEDIMARYNRLLGKSTLFVPGADHAGFETQVVYEKQLAKEGKSRFDFSREELYKRIWDFVAQNRETFEKQFRGLGASVDWDHFTFTLDDKVVKQAYATFKKMWDEDLIYRGERLVNYCTFHRTGFADIEVVYEDTTTPLYYMKYGPFTLATTRPETKFGDTAVAVHPDDTRYKEWIGKVVTVESVNGPFEIRVIADEMVDPNFGTGVVKITPAHDFNDWEVAQRHNLPAVRVINHDGTLNKRAGRFAGMTIMEARKAVAEALKEKGLLVKVDEQYRNRVGRCYKCGTVIEPMLMEQWFVDMKPLASEAIKALTANKIKFYPESKKEQLIRYLQGLKDWNISRQIAWGIPIPAFQNVDDSDDWIFDTRVDQEILEIGNKTYRRDPDVFDTWFSSGSWPYVTLGFPNGDSFKRFYPLSVMETGGEILYPWVSRMIMLGLYVTGNVPFTSVYIHGYVMAEDGAKMSKSLGNVVDLEEVIDTYGSDALRMGIINGRVPAVNRGYDRRKVEDARNFCNKLWNVARFIEDKLPDNHSFGSKPSPATPVDHWVLSRLQQTSEAISVDLDNFRFSEAYEKIYHLLWDDVADWYIEASKSQPNLDLLAYVLRTVLIIAHPFAPFITETIWQTLKPAGDNSVLATASWPKVPKGDVKQTHVFEEVKTIVGEIRYTTSVLNAKDTSLYYTGEPFLKEQGELIKRLARLKNVSQVKAGKGLFLTQTTYRVWLDIDTETIEHFTKELQRKKQAQEKTVSQLGARLKNKEYVKNAPAHVVEQTKQQLEEARTLLANQQAELKRFSGS